MPSEKLTFVTVRGVKGGIAVGPAGTGPHQRMPTKTTFYFNSRGT
jgi:hypothetical protein